VVISVIFSGIILLPFTGNFLKSITNPGETGDLVNMTKSPVFVILSALVGALTLPLLPLFSCILYFNAKAREDMSQSLPTPGTENNRVRVEDLYAKPYSEDHPDNPDNKG
jgi:hypothetical protein